MPKTLLNEITTQWTSMENLAKNGPMALADYLAFHYFDVIAETFKKCCARVDDFRAHELASDIIYDLIKNDYQGILRLTRDRGHLRGLLFKIIRAKLSKLRLKPSAKVNFEQEFCEQEVWLDIYLDVEAALEQLEEEKPTLYQALFLHCIEGKTVPEIAKKLSIPEGTVKSRLFSARQWLSKLLSAYQE